jgi:hypothetical protein
MGLNELTLITHTHTDCKVLWKPYFDSYKEFFNHDKHIVLVNEFSNEIPHEQFIYSDTTKYSNRIIECLKTINTKYVSIDFEDMFLYDDVKIDELIRIITVMTKHDEFFFTRLIKSGIKSSKHFDEKLFLMDSRDFCFSITPTIWRTGELLELLSELTNLGIWELEINGDVLIKSKSIKSLYYFDNDKHRGGHYDSTIYPHICSSILKGKWNLSEYSDILTPIIEKYKININEKGVC